MESKKRRWPLIVFIIFIIAVAALYAYLYLFPEISGSFTETYTVVKGTVTQSSKLNAIVVRDEEAILSDASGSISFYSKETEKTREKATVADIYSNGEKHSQDCYRTGIVSYYLDGYEGILSPDTLGGFKVEDYMDFNVVPSDVSGKSTVSKGEPIYKLIKSNTWYFVLIIPKENKPLYPINGTLKICLEDETVIPASVLRYVGLGDTIAVVASTKTYYADFAKLRSVSVEVINKETEGYLIPATAIDVKDEKQGVWVLGVDEEYNFKEIEVLCEDGDNTLISADGNIKLYDEILRNIKEKKK